MNILVTNNHLDRLGGSELWTYTVAKELERRGHNVDVFTIFPGLVSEKLPFVSEPKQKYDLAIVNHTTTFKAIKDVDAFKIYTQHGLFCGIEIAPDGADAYVAVSEEIIESSPRDFNLITNGVDCERYSPKTDVGELKKVLCMCQGRKAAEMVRKACNRLGLDFEWIERSVWDVEDKINSAELVVTLGRGAYEAMACGRAVLTFDNRAYINDSPYGDGMVDGNVEELIKNNLSGRALRRYMTVETLMDEIQKYRPEMGAINRGFALKHCNIKDKVDQYLNIYENISGDGSI